MAKMRSKNKAIDKNFLSNQNDLNILGFQLYHKQ